MRRLSETISIKGYVRLSPQFSELVMSFDRTMGIGRTGTSGSYGTYRTYVQTLVGTFRQSSVDIIRVAWTDILL
jgi:hypothetical protein